MKNASFLYQILNKKQREDEKEEKEEEEEERTKLALGTSFIRCGLRAAKRTYSTWTSRVVPHRTTIQARTCLRWSSTFVLCTMVHFVPKLYKTLMKNDTNLTHWSIFRPPKGPTAKSLTSPPHQHTMKIVLGI